MPVIIPKSLPATITLEKEAVFVMNEFRASSQDIRPLKLVIVNLMPKKIETETQLLRLLSNNPLQIEIDLIAPKTHESKNTPKEHLLKFYETFDDIRHKHYDGCIITGAPVEHLDFEQVDYWRELTEILNFCKTNVYSTMFICWASQAALYYYYGIPKVPMEKKVFGVFEHSILEKKEIVRGFDDIFYIPHSRHTETLSSDIEKIKDLSIIVKSKEAGVYLTMDKNKRFIFVSGHAEYDRFTLDNEYKRDLSKGLDIEMPKNYYPNNDINSKPYMKWRAHSYLLFSNWLNYHVYQDTPYDLSKLKEQNL